MTLVGDAGRTLRHDLNRRATAEARSPSPPVRRSARTPCPPRDAGNPNRQRRASEGCDLVAASGEKLRPGSEA